MNWDGPKDTAYYRRLKARLTILPANLGQKVAMLIIRGCDVTELEKDRICIMKNGEKILQWKES